MKRFIAVFLSGYVVDIFYWFFEGYNINNYKILLRAEILVVQPLLLAIAISMTYLIIYKLIK